MPTVDGYKVLEPAVIVEKLPEGGMAAVYRGMHLDLKVEVAVKVLKRTGESAYSAQAVARFRQEAEQAARLNDPNLVRIYDFPANRLGLLYLVMEYIDGETLESRIHRKGRLHPHEAATIAMLATRGLHNAHSEGVIHRDIKPPNILLSKKGKVKVTDLGIAKAQDSAAMGMTQEITLLGTPQYMSPELWRGARFASAASDVFAMGATLAFMLTGRHVLDGQDAQEIMHRVLTEGFPDLGKIAADTPPALVEITRLCTLTDPRQRITVEALLAQLGTVIAGYGGEFPLADPKAGATVQPLSPTRFPSRGDLEVIRKKIDEIDAALSEPKPVPRTMRVTDDPSTAAAAMQAFLGEQQKPKAPVPRTPPPPPAPRQVIQPQQPPQTKKPEPAYVAPASYPPTSQHPPAQVYFGPAGKGRKQKKKSGVGGALFVLLLLALIAGTGVFAVQEGWLAQLQAYLTKNDPPATQPTTQSATQPTTRTALWDPATRPVSAATQAIANAATQSVATSQPAVATTRPTIPATQHLVATTRPVATQPVVIGPATRPENPLGKTPDLVATRPATTRPIEVATTKPVGPVVNPLENKNPPDKPVVGMTAYEVSKKAIADDVRQGNWNSALTRLAELRRLAVLESKTADFATSADSVLTAFRADQSILSLRRKNYPTLETLMQPAFAEGSSVAALLMAEFWLDYEGAGATKRLRALDDTNGFAQVVRFLEQVKPASPQAAEAKKYLHDARLRQVDHLADKKNWAGLVAWLSEIPVDELTKMRDAGQSAPYAQAMQTVGDQLQRLWTENKDLAERQQIVRDPRPLAPFANAGSVPAAILLAESLLRYQGEGPARRMVSTDAEGSFARIIELCVKAQASTDPAISAAAGAYLFDAYAASVADAGLKKNWATAVDSLARGIVPLTGDQRTAWMKLAEKTLMDFRADAADLDKRRETYPDLTNQLEPLALGKVHAAMLVQSERYMSFDKATPPRVSPVAGDPEFRLTLDLLSKVIEAPATPADVRAAALDRQWDVYAYYARKSLDEKRADRTLDKLKLVAKCDATETRISDYAALVDEIWPPNEPKVAPQRVTLAEDLMQIKENERGTRSVGEKRPAILGGIRALMMKTRDSVDARSRARANGLLGEVTLATPGAKASEAFAFFKDGCRVERQGELADPIALMGLALFWSLNDQELAHANYADPLFEELRQVQALQRTLKTLALYREAARSTDKYANFLAGQYTWLALKRSPTNTQLTETYLKAAIDRGHVRARAYLNVVRSGGE
ncbi:protein kinase [Humisphaera borealis]|uniref:Protein kinase n=1 Tax=Humisphaera borealis TaxID=2807512 RepID=A0A7M2X5S7_9BACT|nr:protein kinase [Humisphaera borealis]